MSAEQNPIDIPCKTCQVPLTVVNKAEGKYVCPSCKKPYQLTKRAPSKVLNCKECGGLPCSRIESPDGNSGQEWFQCNNCSKKYRRTTTVTYKQERRAASIPVVNTKACCVHGCNTDVRRGQFCFMHLCRLCFNQLPSVGAVHCGCACSHPSFCYNAKMAGSAYCPGHQCPHCPNAKPGEDGHCGCQAQKFQHGIKQEHHSVAVPVQHFYIPQGAAGQWSMNSGIAQGGMVSGGMVAGPLNAGAVRTMSNLSGGMVAGGIQQGGVVHGVGGGAVRTMSNMQAVHGGGFVRTMSNMQASSFQQASNSAGTAGTLHAIAAFQGEGGTTHAVASMSGPQHAEY